VKRYKPSDDCSTGRGSVLQCICTLRHAQLNLDMIKPAYRVTDTTKHTFPATYHCTACIYLPDGMHDTDKTITEINQCTGCHKTDSN